MKAKLDEIHTWFEDNLKNPPQRPNVPHRKDCTSCDSGSFALYEERVSAGSVRAIVCPRARLEDFWTDESEPLSQISGRNIFKCFCSSRMDSHNLQYTRKLVCETILGPLKANIHSPAI